MTRYLALFAAVVTLSADEGLWPIHQLPRQTLEEKYHFECTPDWIAHVQASCLRHKNGGSASFVSPRGLFITNYHVGYRAIFERGLLDKSFYASKLEDELPCPGIYVDQLIEIRDITGESPHIETDLHAEIVTFYGGLKTYLYLYKRFTDVRLVMAPETSIALFGGNTDNFEFPRYSFDLCFFRVYDNGKPLATPDHFRWHREGPKEAELLFLAGNPGPTERRYTADHLRFLRDHEMPLKLRFLQERLRHLEQFQTTGETNRLAAAPEITRYANGQKLYTSLAAALHKNELILAKERIDKALQKTLEKNEKNPWTALRETLEAYASHYPAYFVLEGGGSHYSILYDWARALLALHEGEAADPSLSSDTPLSLDLDRLLLTDSLERLSEILGPTHPAVQAALAGKPAADRARELVTGTKLMNLSDRQFLATHPDELAKSTDPMILLAKTLAPYVKAAQQRYEKSVAPVEESSYTTIARLAFAEFGDDAYPDGTSTLRLSIGTLRGYPDGNIFINPTTTLDGLLSHAKAHAFKAPFALPPSWKPKTLERNTTPLNFASTHDTAEGNSGSPIFNTKREFVGLFFDGNSYTIPWDYQFDDRQGRSIAVHAGGILEVLSKIYQADLLVDELVE
jgi:hypothetical protein